MRLPRNVKATVFLEISKHLTGTAKGILKEAAETSGLVAGAFKWCESISWRRRLKGVRVLAQLEKADPLVRKLLHDRNAAVRAQAAEWAAANPVPGVIDDLLALLTLPDAVSEFAVQDSLLRMGPIIVEPLAQYLETNDGRHAEIGLVLAEPLAEPRFFPAARRAIEKGGRGERKAAARLLSAIGGAEAAALLVTKLADPDDEVRAEAARGLGRMRHWPAATHLSGMLADDSWNVRQEAAFALRTIGAPGILLLRRAARAGNRGADIAQMVLDIPILRTVS
ncbi:MAG: HEAT repeat domain-containing protein [Gemmatimonadaceae bacterium]|nr:HEAT repeat domain-containing protein [Gemmatimonadaceae bacterium]